MDGFLYVAGGEDQNDARNQAKHAVSTLCRYTFDCNVLQSIHTGNKLV